MHITNKCLTLKSDIINLQVLKDSNVAISTKDSGAEIYLYEKGILEPHLKIEKVSYSIGKACFSPDGNFFAFEAKFKIFIFDVVHKKIITKIELEKHSVDILSFDTSSKYLLVGTTGGRVFQYRYNSNIALARICSFPYDRPIIQPKIAQGFVTAMAFYDSLFACSGYGGAIFIVDLELNNKKDVITNTKVSIESLCFIDKKTLISGNNDGVIDIISLNNSKTSTRIQTPFKKIKQIVLMPNTNYIIVSSDKKYLIIIDIKEKKIINEKYIEFEENITNVSVLNTHYLLISLNNSSIYQLKLPTLLKLDSLIINNSIHQVFKLIEKEPVMLDEQSNKKLEDEYKKVFKKAFDALINNNKKSAVNILRFFKDIPSKQKDIKLLFEAYDNFEKFKLNVEKQRYYIAYDMCEKYPALKTTHYYNKMEDKWNQNFLEAQKQLLLGDEDGAKKVLNPYRDIKSKKNLIDFLFKYHNEILAFIKAIHDKDNNTIYKISQKHPLFKEIPAYVSLQLKLKYSLEAVNNCIRRSNTKQARKLLEKIGELPNLHQQISELYLKCNYIEKLKDAYSKKDLIKCFKILDEHKFLNDTEFGRFLEDEWIKLIKHCEVYALKGDIKNIGFTLNSLINLESRKDKIGDLLRVAFHTQTKHLLNNKPQQEVSKIIILYLDIFGKDSEITSFIDDYEKRFESKLELDEKYNQRVPRDIWKNADIIIHFANSNPK